MKACESNIENSMFEKNILSHPQNAAQNGELKNHQRGGNLENGN